MHGKIYKIEFGKSIHLAKVLSIRDYFEQLIVELQIETAVRLVREYASLHDLDLLGPLCEMLFIRKCPVNAEDLSYFEALVESLEQDLAPKLLVKEIQNRLVKEEFWEIAAKHQNSQPHVLEMSGVKDFANWLKTIVPPNMRIRKSCRWVILNLSTQDLVLQLPNWDNKYSLKLVQLNYLANWSATPLLTKNRQLEVILAVQLEMHKYSRYQQIAAQTNDLTIFRDSSACLRRLQDLASTLL